MNSLGPDGIQTAPYSTLKTTYTKGRQVRAVYTDDEVLVYQAFNRDIAEYALEHQVFGGEHYLPGRMTWVKTEFLWMMYRSDWARSKNQEMILGIWLERGAFESMLESAVVSKFDPLCFDDEEAYAAIRAGEKETLRNGGGIVRLQWDPSHAPNGAKVMDRRAIQLGLKGFGDALTNPDAGVVKGIVDFTPFVEASRLLVDDHDALLIPVESDFPVPPSALRPLGMIDPPSDDDGAASE